MLAQESFQEHAQVSAPTSLDWTFAVAERSFAEPPADWLPLSYRSQDQTYQFYAPDRRGEPDRGFPLVLYISPFATGDGWLSWQAACRQAGFFYVGPHGAGNGTPLPLRIRIVLDAFDDIRRTYPIDPDRTYVAGFSGGGYVASQIGVLLPEHFGGIIAISTPIALPKDVLLCRRACERLSTSLVTGRIDPDRGLVEYLIHPLLTESGMNTRLRVFPRLGHALPSGSQLAEVLQWHEASLPHRRALAEARPATRLPEQGRHGPTDRAQALLIEATAALKTTPHDPQALRQLEVVAEGWPDTPAASECLTLIAKLEPADRQAAAAWRDSERYRRHRANAIGGESLAVNTKGFGKHAALRTVLARSATQFWQGMLTSDDPSKRREAEARLRTLATVPQKPESRRGAPADPEQTPRPGRSKAPGSRRP
jgi:pimeloyl-ACP methyl ester carboxylesterase